MTPKRLTASQGTASAKSFKGCITTSLSYMTLVLVAAIIHLPVMSSAVRFPQPYLTVDHNAKVLRMNCSLPDLEAFTNWDTVYKISIKATLHGQNGNVTVAEIEETKKPQRGQLLDNIVGDVGGILDSGTLKKDMTSMYLSVTMVLESGQYGNYYCDFEHSVKDNPSITPIFSRKFYVGEEVSPQNRAIKVLTVDRVIITWQHPPGSEFLEAMVSQMYVSEAGRQESVSQFLFFVSQGNIGVKSKTLTVLLASMSPPSREKYNYTMTVHVYVNNYLSKKVFYTCFVPYIGCYTDNKKMCECNNGGIKLFPTEISKSDGNSVSKDIGLGVLSFLCVVCMVSIIVAVCLVRNKKCLIAYKLLKINEKMQRKSTQDPATEPMISYPSAGQQTVHYTTPPSLPKTSCKNQTDQVSQRNIRPGSFCPTQNRQSQNGGDKNLAENVNFRLDDDNNLPDDRADDKAINCRHDGEKLKKGMLKTMSDETHMAQKQRTGRNLFETEKSVGVHPATPETEENDLQQQQENTLNESTIGAESSEPNLCIRKQQL